MADSKICKKCNENLPLSQYYKYQYTIDGYRTKCKSCMKELKLQKEKTNLNIKMNVSDCKDTDQKLCNQCNKVKAISEFNKNAILIHHTCTECYITNRKNKNANADTFIKKCSSCKLDKETIFYYKSKKGKDGYREKCIECSKYDRENVPINKERNERFIKDQVKECSGCKEEKPFSEFTPDVHCKFGLKSKCKACIYNVKKTYVKAKKATDPIYKLECNLRSRLRNAIDQKRNGGAVKSARTRELLGADMPIVFSHIELQFQEGMTWQNYGKWHVDHILPCASFDLSKPEEQFKCFNYKNLQPLWAVDNLRKHAKLNYVIPSKIPEMLQ